MAFLEALITVVSFILIPPFVLILATVVLSASVGKSFGLREKYVQCLLKVFEFGKTRLAQKPSHASPSSDSDSESSEDELLLHDDTEDEDLDNDQDEVIEREVVLRPRFKKESMSFNGTEDFKLWDPLYFVRTGIEAIVDDEVTKRFSAEELKSWNLLTRTNARHQFISYRLTIMWAMGFLMRYFILFPLRVAILIVGSVYMVFSCLFVGMMEESALKRWLAQKVFVSVFRIYSRAISAVVTYHNQQNKPRTDGFCVANHTTPIDCAVLACDGCYALTAFFVGCTYIVGSLPQGALKKKCNYHVTKCCFEVLSGALSLVCTYHNRQNIPSAGICVANHTSPMDALVLACDNTYDLVGQKHGGFLGLLQHALSKASAHIFFERSEAKDRHAVTKRLREHVEDPDKCPILIFPEGTCINNTSVMQFKKGTFEVGGTIYPVAIKYDPRFGDAFWNSSQNGMLSYMIMMMTSWAIVCDVWYLPPMTRKEGETSIDFANRVKSEIATQGGLVDLIWDGGLKRTAPKEEWRKHYQQEFSKRLRLYSTGCRQRKPTTTIAEEPQQTTQEERLFNESRTESEMGRRLSETSNTESDINTMDTEIDGAFLDKDILLDVSCQDKENLEVGGDSIRYSKKSPTDQKTVLTEPISNGIDLVT